MYFLELVNLSRLMISLKPLTYDLPVSTLRVTSQTSNFTGSASTLLHFFIFYKWISSEQTFVKTEVKDEVRKKAKRPT